MAASTKGSLKNPPEFVQSLQYDLFSQFLGNEKELSNTVELWDSIPKYFVSKKKQNNLRDEKGYLPLLERKFQFRCVDCSVEIQPALIFQKDGSQKAFYPSETEELIEDVLKKIFTDQRHGIHDVGNMDSWVKFSAQMVCRELASMGKKRSLDEVKHAIEILSECKVRLLVDGKKIYSESILSSLITVTREDYLQDASSLWVARLPFLVSQSINELSYRQYDYVKVTKLKEPLSRWFAKYLCHFYTNAHSTVAFTILLSEIKRDSGYLDTCNSVTKEVMKFEDTLCELKDKKFISSFGKTNITGRRNSIFDVEYKIFAHPDFAAKQKAANARKKNDKAKLGLSVDNSKKVVGAEE